MSAAPSHLPSAAPAVKNPLKVLRKELVGELKALAEEKAIDPDHIRLYDADDRIHIDYNKRLTHDRFKAFIAKHEANTKVRFTAHDPARFEPKPPEEIADSPRMAEKTTAPAANRSGQGSPRMAVQASLKILPISIAGIENESQDSARLGQMQIYVRSAGAKWVGVTCAHLFGKKPIGAKALVAVRTFICAPPR
jgi:hypothetical protein